MGDYLEYNGEIVSRGKIPKDLWGLLIYAAMWDFNKIQEVKRRIDKENKKLIAVYPGVPELMKGIDISKMEYIGSIMDGDLYLK